MDVDFSGAGDEQVEEEGGGAGRASRPPRGSTGGDPGNPGPQRGGGMI